MEDRETSRIRKYGESETTRITIATVPHVTSGSDLENFRPMDICSTVCTCCLENYEISYSTANVYEAVLEYI